MGVLKNKSNNKVLTKNNNAIMNDIVGLEVDFENNVFTRLAGAVGKSAGTDFNGYPMYGGRRRCNVLDNGNIVAFLGDGNFKEDGSNGQVMVFQPKFYYKVVPLKMEAQETGIGYHLRKVQYYISANPHDGFKLHPAFYNETGDEVDYILYSAYEGSMWDASQEKYVNDNLDIDIAYAAGDLLCSVANKKPISGLRTGIGTKENFEAMANNRGSGWHLETIKAVSANQLLMIIEIGMMNTQTGIGQGVVSITDNSSYNCASLTGSTSSLGNKTGNATSTISEIGGVETTETASGKVAVTYRGVENPWGNINKHIQGINIWGDGGMAGGQPYVCNDLSSFNESSNSGHYEGTGFTIPNANGNIKAMGYGNPDFDWLLMPSEIGGDSSLPVGDYCFVTSNLNGYRNVSFGGWWKYGIADGGFFWHCAYAVGSHYKNVGGSLVYIPDNYHTIQYRVRQGKAAQYYKVRDEITVKKGDETLTWQVLGIDEDIPANRKYKHSLTLGLKDIYANIQFAPRQALFYCENGLAAGTYNFTIKQHNWVSSDVNKTFQFTLTQAVPAKGQIVLMTTYNVTIAGSTVKTFASATATAEIETATVTEGSAGTSLGDVNNAINENTNSLQRGLIGSNNYADSPMRQYINSSAAAGSVWTPKTKFDRPPFWVTTTAGFLNDVDKNFLSVIGEVIKKTALNTVSDGGGSIETNEKFFLLSRSEIYGGDEVTGGEGAAYSYYANYSDLAVPGVGNDVNRIKYMDGAARNWWLRSPYISYAYNVRIVSSTGNVGNYFANYNYYGIAPACCII